jgi:hypothetical protein
MPPNTNIIAIEQDPYRQSREKRQKTRKLLRRFFGISARTDISVLEIEKHGLCYLLQSNIPLAHFLYYSLSNYNSENLFFYLEVESFEEHEFKDAKSLKRTATYLCDAFIKSDGDFELNIAGSVREGVLHKIEAGDHNCFSETRDQAIGMLEPSFEEFMMSEDWKAFKDRVKEKTGGLNKCMYGEDMRDEIVSKIVEKLDDLDSQKKVLKAEKSAERRAILLREMIHDFCKARLRCDFHDKVKSEQALR